jgi:hypothetical protein
MPYAWFAILGCSLIALVFGITGLVRLVVLLWLRSNSISATGRVVRLEPGPLYTWMDGQPPYTPVAEFEADGQRYEAKGATRSYPPLYSVGDSVKVCYPADRPDRGRIVTGREEAAAWFFLAFGIVLGFVALVIARLVGTT